MSKTNDTSFLKNQLSDSVFFRKEKKTEQPQEVVKKEEKQKKEIEYVEKITEPEQIKKEVIEDIEETILEEMDLKKWKDLIENTETQKTTLRLTKAELYSIADMISELQRKQKIKISMNEIARLGLLFLIHDFKKNKQQSLLYKVKKS